MLIWGNVTWDKTQHCYHLWSWPKKVAQSEVQHKIWACKAAFLSRFIAVTATPIRRKLFNNYSVDKTYNKTDEKSESLFRTPTSFISTNSGCIVVECMPSLWKNSLTFSAIFIYSDKFLNLKNTMQQSVQTNLNHVHKYDKLQILYWPPSHPTS